jgi:cell division protein FtsQ
MKNTSNNADYKNNKNLRKKRARAKRIRRLLFTIIVVTAAIIFARSSFFIVDEIKVTGNKKYSSSDIIFNTGLVTGQNVFKMLGEKPKNLISFRFIDREQNVYESMSYVKTVSVRPLLPKAIRIKIQERTPFAIVDTNGISILIDKEGYALEIVKNPEVKKKYFKIIGTSVDSYNLGQEVKFKGESPLQLIILFCDTLLKSDKTSDIKLYEKFTSIKVSDINSVTANFEGRIDGEFADLDNIEYDLKVFKQIFTNNITKNQKGTLVFSSGSEHPYFVPKD